MSRWIFVGVIAACGGGSSTSVDGPRPDGPTHDAGPVDAVALTGLFALALDVATETAPVSVAVGDLNGDGKPDIVVASSGSGTASVLLNMTPVGASAPVLVPQAELVTAANPTSVVLADFDGDGVLDVAVAGGASPFVVSVFLNRTAAHAGTTSFAARQDIALNANSPGLAVADLNRDGKPDLAVSYFCSSTIMCLSVLLDTTAPGAATPSFAPRADFTTNDRSYVVAIGDIDGDGAPDLALPYYAHGNGAVGVFLNTTLVGATTATLAAEVDVTTTTTQGDGALADINGDGRADLIVVAQPRIQVLVNTTSGATPTFAAPVDIAAGSSSVALAIGDVDRDGMPDLVVANALSNDVSVFRNTSATTASFADAVSFPVGTHPRAIALRDLDGDGKLDAIVANSGANSISILMGR